ncbi:BrnA antitoxin family protein [uncultured Roseobacter sp.]|uniref:BrnA antitoxin family protein n=1 Tax=uncultured Roseobacter sp. TaxID=114847 RepID=UPI002606D168|nr:BrnA antitoxin family protein [uncultured Roseobacter sp.]
MSNIKRASLEELRAMKERGEIAPPRPDAQEIDMPEGFWDAAKPQMPKAKKAVSMRVDPDILEFFKGQGDGYLTRMHSVLRLYVDAQKNRHTPS